MAAEVGTAYLTVMPSARGFAKSLGGQIDGTFVAAGRQGGQSIGDEAGKSGGKSFAAAGAKLAGAFAVAFAAVGATAIVKSVASYLTDAIGSASELEQSVGGVDAVFKESADQIHEWAKAAADSVGLAQSEYNSLSTVLGAQLKNMGIPLDEVATKTGWLVTLGADLAAQFGGSTSDAVSALSSLLRGERDPIERYGISINEARVQAKMAEMGLSDLTGEAETNAKMQATLALLTEQSADAQGAFARESGTAAGQQQRLKAELENVKTEIGTALLPVVTDLLGVFRDEAVPVLQNLAAWFTNNKTEVYNLGIAVATSAITILDAMLAMGEGAANLNLMVYTAMRAISLAFFAGAQAILSAAEIGFGWIPGVGDNLEGLKGNLTSAQQTADVAFGLLQSDAREARDMFSSGRDAVSSLRTAVENLNGTRATVYLNAQGNAMELYQSRPGLTPHLVPGRATGGPVTAGRPYIVGEKEAELFVPGQSGVILNQQQIAAAAGRSDAAPIEMNIYPQAGQSERAIGDAAARRLSLQMSGVLG